MKITGLWEGAGAGRLQQPHSELTSHARVLSFYTHSRYHAVEPNRACWTLLSLRTHAKPAITSHAKFPLPSNLLVTIVEFSVFPETFFRLYVPAESKAC